MNSIQSSIIQITESGEIELEPVNFVFNNSLLETDTVVFNNSFPIWNYYILKDYLLSLRRARPKTQTRGDMNASNRKMRVQKHTGYARLGARSSSSRVGGIKAFGPTGRNHEKKINKTFFSKFIINAVWKKINEKKLIIVNSHLIKTKIGQFSLDNILNKCLLSENKNIYCLGNIAAIRNIENIKNINFNSILTPLCYNHSIIITLDQWEILSNRFNILTLK